MITKILHSKIMIFILVLFAFILPPTINKPDQTQQFSVVLGVGIDKIEDKFEVSTQVLTSKSNQGFLESLQVHSATGENILDAVEKLSLHIGRISGFGNNSVIVFCKDVAKEDISNMLDFFLRSKRLNGNPIIMVTENKAKDILSDVAKIDESFNYSLNSVAHLNKEFASGIICTLEQFLDDYYGKTKATLVGVVNETKKTYDGIEIPSGMGTSSGSGANSGGGGSSGGSSGSSGGSGGGQEEKKVLSNDGDAALFVDGKNIAFLDNTIVEGLNILTNSSRNVYTLKNVNDKFFKNADVVLSVRNKVFTWRTGFSKNGIPRVFFDITYTLKVEQIIQNGNDRIVLDGSNNYLTPEVIRRFKLEVMDNVSSAIQVTKEYNADVYGLQLAFYRHNPIKWKNYIKELADKADAYKNIEMFLNMKVKGNL